MMDRLLQQAKRQYSVSQRLIALSAEAVFFTGILPWVLLALAAWLDQWLHLPRFSLVPLTAVLGCLLAVTGFLFALWTVYIQFTIGKGTPVPVMATQVLIIQGPYAYCRNPMALGTVVFYLGIAVVAGSVSAVGLVLVVASALLGYIKVVEEREMVLRFGAAYLEYKAHTPFIIPRLRRKR